MPVIGRRHCSWPAAAASGVLVALVGSAHAGCSGPNESYGVFGVEVPCRQRQCTTLEEQGDFVDALIAATGGEQFALETCNHLLSSVDTSGFETWYELDSSNLVAAETTGGPEACLAERSSFCFPTCSPPMFVAKNPQSCGDLVLTGDAKCDACLAQNCCNVASYCAAKGPVCAGVLACQRAGGISCSTEAPVEGQVPLPDDVVTLLTEELEICGEAPGCPSDCPIAWLRSRSP